MYVQFFCLDNLLSFVWFLSITYFLYIHAGNLELLHIAKTTVMPLHVQHLLGMLHDTSTILEQTPVEESDMPAQ